MKKYSKGKRQQNKEAKKAAALGSTEQLSALKLKKRVSGAVSMDSQATAPTNIKREATFLTNDSSPMSLVPQ